MTALKLPPVPKQFAPGPTGLVELEVELLQPGPFQPRRRHSPSHLEALAESIRRVGVIEPICVRASADSYQIIAGEGRWRAAKMAGLARVPCQVFTVTETQAFVLALLENLQRQDLSALEEAFAYQQLLDRGIARNRAAIARLLGVTRARITQRMKLLELDHITQEKLDQHRDLLTEYHGRILWEVRDPADRRQFADQAVENRWSGAQLKAAVVAYQHANEVAAWQQENSALPRSYRVSYPGFQLSINLRQCDLSRVAETLLGIARRVGSLQALRR